MLILSRGSYLEITNNSETLESFWSFWNLNAHYCCSVPLHQENQCLDLVPHLKTERHWGYCNYKQKISFIFLLFLSYAMSRCCLSVFPLCVERLKLFLLTVSAPSHAVWGELCRLSNNFVFWYRVFNLLNCISFSLAVAQSWQLP